LHGLYQELLRLDQRIIEYDGRIARLAEQSAACQRVMSIPGIGPLTATALVAAAGDAKVFRSGREMAAWLGLVPRQHSTGGKARLLGISKRGDPYLRRLLIHGARAVLRVAPRKHDRRSRWVTGLLERKHVNVTAVAMANKNVRTAWALLTRDEMFDSAVA
jgi:transposase